MMVCLIMLSLNLLISGIEAYTVSPFFIGNYRFVFMLFLTDC